MPRATTLLLTRPETQARRFADQVRAALGEKLPIVISPILAIVPKGDLPPLAGFSALIFTSENAVRIAAQQADLAGRRAYCVGARTAEAARALGMDTLSADGDADALVALIWRENPNGKLLHLRGHDTRGAVAERLNLAGIETECTEIYRQDPRALSGEARALLNDGGRVILPLFSPRSARLAGVEIAGARSYVHAIALSPAVARSWAAAGGGEADICARPDAAAMLDRIVATLET